MHLSRLVSKALDKKRRPGQYAVVWDGEKVVQIGGSPTEDQQKR